MSKFVVSATWDDVPHLTAAAKAELWQSIPAYQRDARSKGIPQLGSGAIYPISEDEIVVDPFELPAYYRHVYALDVGWNRTAALWCAIDPETDTGYLYSEHYRGQAEPEVHAAAVRARGEWIPGVIDPAARGRSQIDGRKLVDEYNALGLRLTPAVNAVEAGIHAVWSRLGLGRLKVFRTLGNFLAEYRLYRRDDVGRVVKENDHLMDDMRYIVMSGWLLAAQRPREEWAAKAAPRRRGHQVDYNPLPMGGAAQRNPYYRG